MSTNTEIESRVGGDGVLTIRVPFSASDANTEVIVTIRPKRSQGAAASRSTWPPGYFEKTYGSMKDEPMEIPSDPTPQVLVTHNCDEFRRVPGLNVEGWEATP